METLAIYMDLFLPKIFPTMSERDTLVVAEWYVHERDIVQPGQLLVEIDAPVGLIAIPTPPDMTVPHRVTRIAKRRGQPICLGDLFLRLEPAEASG